MLSVRSSLDCRISAFVQPSLLPRPAQPFRLSASLSRRPYRAMALPPISFVTGNQNKLREVSQILASDPDANSSISIIARKIDLPELQGEPDDIARQKCALAVKEVKGPTVSFPGAKKKALM